MDKRNGKNGDCALLGGVVVALGSVPDSRLTVTLVVVVVVIVLRAGWVAFDRWLGHREVIEVLPGKGACRDVTYERGAAGTRATVTTSTRCDDNSRAP